jgi:O-acetyl-ADP-ribose deacetylase (regulator of RNase III)
MIHEVSGDILLTQAQAVAHGIAPNDPFDRGLALHLREKFPAMHKDYRHYAHQVHPKPGEMWVWSGVGGVRIVNLLTQEGTFDHGGKPGKATLANVLHALKRLRHWIEAEQIATLALPRLATGVGALDWNAVRPLIDAQLGDLKTHVYLYSAYHAGQQAVEPGT